MIQRFQEHTEEVRTQSSAKPSARDRILQAASTLFYQEGTQNVGIDRIIAESGVAKISLYNHFKSKDALIAAWLQQRDANWRQWFQQTVEKQATAPAERLLTMFDALAEWFSQPDFRGCAFINSSVELVDPEHPGYQIAIKHQQGRGQASQQGSVYVPLVPAGFEVQTSGFEGRFAHGRHPLAGFGPPTHAKPYQL